MGARGLTMFNRSGWYHTLREQLRESSSTASELDGKAIATLFRVELGLYLLTILDLNDDPIAVLPAVLSGIPYPALSGLTAEQQRSIAIARLLLSAYSAESAWEEALKASSRLPQDLRTYHVQDSSSFKDQLVAVCQLE